MNGLKYVRPGKGFVPNFTLFSKLDVNGAKEDAFYSWVKVLIFTITIIVFIVSINCDTLKSILGGVMRRDSMGGAQFDIFPTNPFIQIT